MLFTSFSGSLVSRIPGAVHTEHKTFDNMILTGIDYEYKTESALQFDLQFEQIRLVSYATTNAIAVKTASPKSTGGQVKSQVPTNAGTASTTKDTLPTYDGEVK
ncbi:phage baseplate protein [Escherichia coli]|uniref:phage baseplate protein n=1 Tax=Escherichia coli TaxID=562 RepID=UPI00320B3C6F